MGADDRVTLRLQPPPTLQIIFHRGARRKRIRISVSLTKAACFRWLRPIAVS
jgi:hypothetical protein